MLHKVLIGFGGRFVQMLGGTKGCPMKQFIADTPCDFYPIIFVLIGTIRSSRHRSGLQPQKLTHSLTRLLTSAFVIFDSIGKRFQAGKLAGSPELRILFAQRVAMHGQGEREPFVFFSVFHQAMELTLKVGAGIPEAEPLPTATLLGRQSKIGAFSG